MEGKEKMLGKGANSERARRNVISVIVSAILMCTGILCLLIKISSVRYEYIDTAGMLHENFFLLPIGFFLIFSGIITFIFLGISNLLNNKRNRALKDGYK